MTSQSSEQPTQSKGGLLSFTSAASGNRFWQIAIPIFFLTAFLSISRVLDVIRFLDPQDKYLRITGLLLFALGICLLAGGRALIFWKTATGKVLPFFVAWVLMTYFLTQHSEGSTLYAENIVQGALLFAASTGLLTTVADFRKLFVTLAYGCLSAAVLGIVWSTMRNGRLTLRDGPYSDPNYYAMWLLVLAPIIWISLPSKTLPTRIGALAATAFPILMALRTTSRGGFVGMFAMLVIVFFLSSFKMRIIIASLSAVGLVVMLAFLPASLRSRLAASARITSSETNIGPGDQGQIGGDNSAVSRGTLLETGIALTLENPVIGVGPGNFGPTVVDIGRSQGFDWVPLNTHNAYTQISSETGIPGFILYLVLIGFSAKSVVSLLRQTSTSGATPDSQLHLLASGMLVSLAGVLTCIFFLSEGYNQLVYLWLGIACGLRLIIPKPQSEDEEFIEMDPEQLSPAP